MAIADVFARRCLPVFQLLTAQIAARHFSVGAPLLAVRIRRPSFEGPFPPKKPGYAVILEIYDYVQVNQRWKSTVDDRLFSDLICKEGRHQNSILISKGPQQGTVHNCLKSQYSSFRACTRFQTSFSGLQGVYEVSNGYMDIAGFMEKFLVAIIKVTDFSSLIHGS